MGDLYLVFKGASLGVSVAKYAGIIEDHLKLQIEQLVGSELDAGLRALQQAATSEREQTFLLREARGCFNKAISLEKSFRLAAAYLGLALCHACLGDAINAEKAISAFVKFPPPRPSLRLHLDSLSVEMTARQLKAMDSLLGRSRRGGILFAHNPLVRHKEAVAKLMNLQQEAKRLLERSLRDGCESVFGLIS